jgi:crossover junction endodeoxyribonuclease RuvC
VIILGIDPGIAITGYGIIDTEGNIIKLLDFGCIRTDAKIVLEKRLEKIYLEISNLINKWFPREIVIEELFFNKNTKTALTVGQARGVVLLAAAQNQLPVSEYTPLQVKQSVVGYGRADKQQVQYMVKNLLNLSSVPKPDDAADALAIAICHAYSYRFKRKVGQRER